MRLTSGSKKNLFINSVWVCTLVGLLLAFGRSYYSYSQLKSNYGLTVGQIIELRRQNSNLVIRYKYLVNEVNYTGEQGALENNIDSEGLYLVAFELQNPSNSYINSISTDSIKYGERYDSLKGEMKLNWDFWHYQENESIKW